MPPHHPFYIPHELLKEKLRRFLEEDLPYGDLSTGILPSNPQVKAEIISKSEGILAGSEEASVLFSLLQLEVYSKKKDGDPVSYGETVMEIEGPIKAILVVERTALNFMMKMSSIASSTHAIVLKLRSAGLSTIVAATRKTTPGFSFFEKKAVAIGGGDTHRWNLSDMVMCKDTHRSFFEDDVIRMLTHVKTSMSFSKKIEVEVETEKEFLDALETDADIIMLDNFSAEKIKELIDNNQEKILKTNKILEASGNITPENILEYAKAGVHVISTSKTILSPHVSMDFSLKIRQFLS